MNQIHGQEFIFDDVSIYGVSELYGYDFEQFYAFFTSNQYELNNIAPEGNLTEILDQLSSKYKMSLITGRPNEWMNSAVDWITKNNLAISNHFCASEYADGKAGCAKKLGITVFIEDHPKHALEIAEEGIQALLIDKPYNQECRHPNIIRVNEWEEIARKLVIS
ncbi:NIF family HAD-type phosphatase [Paenibacillus albiflavus]|uniref:NIF family HAD-type phosphatase n=1 Tax=Paenibacillus albiflavus TaxID=2545760 RepID=UPI001404677B|nr:NIF family HAD-type phosphatase [Paenibacillus albiflavus]